MNNPPQFDFIVEYVTDSKASKQFYVDVLGFDIQREHPAYVQFDTFAIASDEPMEDGGKPEPYWLVDDIETAFNTLSQKADVSLSLIQRLFGKILGIKDPDGRPRYLLELSQKRPSQPAQ